MKDVLPSRSPSADTRACHAVSDAAGLALHHRIRRTVFVDEQALFDDDTDEHDTDPATVHVLGEVDGQPAGTVRLYPIGGDPIGGGLWKGDRLAVLPDHRHSGIGGPLVRYAVATAASLGGSRMVATVQAVNTTFFLHLGWTAVGGPVAHLGVPHQLMTIDWR